MDVAPQPATAPPIGVALVGTGAIATSHARALRRSPALHPVAVASRSLESAESFVARHDWGGRAPVATGLDEALAHPLVQLVVVATPTGTHVGIAERVLRADRHLLLEKPVDVDPVRAAGLAAVAAEAEDRGLAAAAVSQHRFDPASQLVREAVDDGRFGRLCSGLATVPWWRAQAYYDAAPWRGTVAMDGGGALMNQGIHTLDLLLWYLGEPVRVMASARTIGHERIEVEDVLGAVIEFDSGALATLHATTAAYPGLGARLQLMGTAGSAVIEQDGLAYLHLRDDDDPEPHRMGASGDVNRAPEELRPQAGAHRDPTLDPNGLLRQYADVERAIRTGARPGVTIGDAVATLAVIDALYRSASSGRAVDLAPSALQRAATAIGTETA